MIKSNGYDFLLIEQNKARQSQQSAVTPRILILTLTKDLWEGKNWCWKVPGSWDHCSPRKKYNEKKDMLSVNDWTKNQVAIYHFSNEQELTPGTELPVPDCFGTIVSPNMVLTTITCLIEYATSGVNNNELNI